MPAPGRWFQRALGNQTLGRLIQTKLTVNQPGDKYEREADRVAEVVMRMPLAEVPEVTLTAAPEIRRACAACESGTGLCSGCEEESALQRAPAAESMRRRAEPEEEEQKLQAKGVAGDSPRLDAKTESRIQALRGRGEALPEPSRRFMEQRFGRDFSRVRVHRDSASAATAAAVRARAFTLGRDVAFGHGQYSPDSAWGRRLLAHELAHVVQQGAAPRAESGGTGAPPNGFSMVASPRVQRLCEGEGMYFSSGGVPPGLDCEAADALQDETTSCCVEGTRSQVAPRYATSREFTDRAIARVASGERMDRAILRHFGADAVWRRDEILGKLRRVRTELDRESSHRLRCRAYPCPASLQLLARSPHLFCRYRVLATAMASERIMTVCVDLDGRPAGDWTTVLHEVVHLAGVGDLPDRDRATPDQLASHEYEVYEGESDLYPGPFSLRNADSFAYFVREIGAPDWTADPVPIGRFFPLVAVGIGTPLSVARPVLVGQLTWTPVGRDLQMIAGATGLWTLPLDALERERPLLPTEMRAYVGAETGLRWVMRTRPVRGVFDVAGGAGAYVTESGEVDPAFSVRVGAGVRFGGPEAGFGISAELMRLIHLGGPDVRVIGGAEQDWVGGLMFRGHWGGTASRPR